VKVTGAIFGSMSAGDPSPLADPGGSDPYDMFAAVVALHQLSEWLPVKPCRVLDVSLPPADFAADVDASAESFDQRISDVAMSAGHHVTTVLRPDVEAKGGRRTHPVVIGDPRRLTWVRSQSIDVLIAEGGALSEWLAAEDALHEVARVLRPGGRLLASADSMVIGLARLAQQHRWSELADAPAADVVLVPDPLRDDAFIRCFAPDDLAELLMGAGLEVDWIRPRTVLPAGAVRQTLKADPSALHDLVTSELRLSRSQQGESHGARLVVSGRKPKQS
jgi:hypothetical protein